MCVCGGDSEYAGGKYRSEYGRGENRRGCEYMGVNMKGRAEYRG